MSQAGSLGGGIIPPGAVVETLTGNTGGPVGPDGASNINVVGTGSISVAGDPGTNTLTISTSLTNTSTSFSAHLTTTQNNVTGDGTVYVIPYDAVYFNNGGNFNIATGEFLAPQDGEYYFNVNISLSNLGAAHTQGQVDLLVNGIDVYNIINWNASTVGDDSGDVLIPGERILSLNTNDTVSAQVTIFNSTLTVDVVGGATTDGVFEGFLVSSLGGLGDLTFDTDSGSATPAGGILNVLGGAHVNTSGAGNTITINAELFTWNEITVVGPTAMAVNNGYIANNVALVDLTLPITAAVGDMVRVEGKGSGLWTVSQHAGQSIRIGNNTTTIGVGGSLTATDAGDGVGLLCITANTGWMVTDGTGSINWV